MINFASFY